MKSLSYSKIFYLIRSLLGYFTVRVCPSCGSNHNVIVDKKYFVTKLLECQQCFLRFRHPPDTERFNFSFYQKRYQQNDSITTDIPSVAVLKEWIEFNFENSPKCAKNHIAIMEAIAGDLKNKCILDYGASWGYTSLQFKNVGMIPKCFEISKPRANFGQNLGLEYYSTTQEVENIHDFFYSSHVIEHLPNPNILFQVAEKSLKNGGVLIVFCPNGSSEHQKANPKNYNLGWGLVHPLYLTKDFFAKKLSNRPYFISSNPFSLEKIRAWDKNSQIIDNVTGDELMVISIW